MPAGLQIVDAGKPWEKALPYSQSIRVQSGPLLFLSGQVALGADGKLVGGEDLSAQTRQVFTNIKDLVEAAGSSMEKVVKLTYFIIDAQQWPIVAAVRSEFFPVHHPASSVVEVSKLLLQRELPYLIEVEAIAIAG